MLPVPVLTPRLSSLWLRLVTPIYAEVGRKLIDSIRHPTLVQDDTALRDFPIHPLGVRECIARALAHEDRESRRNPLVGRPFGRSARNAVGRAPLRQSPRSTRAASYVAVSAAEAFEPIRRIGGDTGWYAANVLWQLRGLLDQLLGGVGMRRGRRDPVALRVGDALDFWRVESFEPGHRLRLAAEMKLPGRAWLEFEVEPEDGGTRIRQTAEFDPVGLAGLAYWYGIYPLHQLVFRGMLRGIARAAERRAGRRSPIHASRSSSWNSTKKDAIEMTRLVETATTWGHAAPREEAIPDLQGHRHEDQETEHHAPPVSQRVRAAGLAGRERPSRPSGTRPIRGSSSARPGRGRSPS